MGASPSPAYPMSKGSLCIKGWLAGDFVGHPDRLVHPLIRQGGQMVKATWDRALAMTGSNTTEQHLLVASYILRARSRGAKLIVADP